MDIALSQDQARAELQSTFVERFEQLRPRLIAICQAIAGADDASDLVHETYLRASERLGQLRDPLRFDAWVVRIALNETKSLLRTQRRRPEQPHGTVLPASGGPDIGLRELVEQLAPRERAVIVLHYAYGYRMGEISRLLDLSEINVRTLAFRARRRLRAQLQEVDG